MFSLGKTNCNLNQIQVVKNGKNVNANMEQCDIIEMKRVGISFSLVSNLRGVCIILKKLLFS